MGSASFRMNVATILVLAFLFGVCQSQTSDPAQLFDEKINPFEAYLTWTTGDSSCDTLGSSLEGYFFILKNSTEALQSIFLNSTDQVFNYEVQKLSELTDYTVDIGIVCKNSTFNSKNETVFTFSTPYGSRADPPLGAFVNILSRTDLEVAWDASEFGCEGEETKGAFSSSFVYWNVSVSGFTCDNVTSKDETETRCVGAFEPGKTYEFSVNLVCENSSVNSLPYSISFTSPNVPNSLDLYYDLEYRETNVTGEFEFITNTAIDCEFFGSTMNETEFSIKEVGKEAELPILERSCKEEEGDNECEIKVKLEEGKSYEARLTLKCKNGISSNATVLTFTVDSNPQIPPPQDVFSEQTGPFEANMKWTFFMGDSEDPCGEFDSEFDGFSIRNQKNSSFSCESQLYDEAYGFWEAKCQLFNASSEYTFEIASKCKEEKFNSLFVTSNFTFYTSQFTVFPLRLIYVPDPTNSTHDSEEERSVSVTLSPDLSVYNNYTCEELGSKTIGYLITSDTISVLYNSSSGYSKLSTVQVTIPNLDLNVGYIFSVIHQCENSTLNAMSMDNYTVERIINYPSSPSVQFTQVDNSYVIFNLTEGEYPCNRIENPGDEWTFLKWDSYLTNYNDYQTIFFIQCEYKENQGNCSGLLDASSNYTLFSRAICTSKESGTKGGYYHSASFVSLGPLPQVRENVKEGSYQFDLNGEAVQVSLPSGFVLPSQATGLYFTSQVKFVPVPLKGFSYVDRFQFEMSGYSPSGQFGGPLSSPLTLSLNVSSFSSIKNGLSLGLYVLDEEKEELIEVSKYCTGNSTSKYENGVFTVEICHFSKFVGMTEDSKNIGPTRIIDYVIDPEKGGLTGAGIAGVVFLAIILSVLLGGVLFVIYRRYKKNVTEHHQIWNSLDDEAANSPNSLLEMRDRSDDY